MSGIEETIEIKSGIHVIDGSLYLDTKLAESTTLGASSGLQDSGLIRELLTYGKSIEKTRGQLRGYLRDDEKEDMRRKHEGLTHRLEVMTVAAGQLLAEEIQEMLDNHGY